MQTLKEHFNTQVNAFLDSTGMTPLPTDPAEPTRGTLGVEVEVEGWVRERLRAAEV
ncbi:hypothetical protein [Candidatus Palauibacter sp.]|uniref:hypothetical protein n=1 Tax=Candidatus Palauibacter sp. TaxID=3101350 RepID=UPI003B51E16E